MLLSPSTNRCLTLAVHLFLPSQPFLSVDGGACAQVSNADVFIPTTGLVDENTVRSAPKLKLIVQPAAGHDNIAVDTAASLGIPVCTAPGRRCCPDLGRVLPGYRMHALKAFCWTVVMCKIGEVDKMQLTKGMTWVQA